MNLRSILVLFSRPISENEGVGKKSLIVCCQLRVCITQNGCSTHCLCVVSARSLLLSLALSVPVVRYVLTKSNSCSNM